MTIKIDWNGNIEIIKSSYRLTDAEVQEALLTLEYAKELYDNSDSIPERIVLCDKNGMHLHTILTREGKPHVVEVSLQKSGWSFFEGYGCRLVLFIIGGFIGASAYYYFS